MPARIILIFTATVIAAWLTVHGYPVPDPDDALFKSPAAEFVQHGRFAGPGLVEWFPRSDEWCAYYPCGSQLLLIAWYRLFGVSLMSSLAFAHTVHLMVSLLAAMVAQRMLLRCGYPESPAVSSAATWVGLFHFSQLGQFDRPEELALLWMWLEYLCTPAVLQRRAKHWLASGLLLGLSAFTAPWVGVLGSLWLTLRTFFEMGQRQPATNVRWPRRGMFFGLCLAGVLVGGTLGAWYLVMELRTPGLVVLQLFGMGDNSYKYHVDGTWTQKVERFWRCTLDTNRPRALLMALVACGLPLACWLRRRAGDKLGEILSLYATGLVSATTLCLVRPTAFTYFAACYWILLPCLGYQVAAVIQPSSSWPRQFAGPVCLSILLSLTSKTVIKLCLVVWTDCPVDRPATIFEDLRSMIPPGERVAVASTHWHAFQDRNPWIDLHFSTIWTDTLPPDCRWVIFPPLHHVRQPDASNLSSFHLVAESHPNYEKSMSYGYSLWKRLHSENGDPQE